MRFGSRLWVAPGDAGIPSDDAVIVRLDPGLAFGTGTHETTAMCLEWLDGLDLRDAAVLDFGCGSGILGIAALKLGAASVDAIDNDLQAITATRQNAARNAVGDDLRAGNDIPVRTGFYDVVVANILANTLIDHASVIAESLQPGGKLALSGILDHQAENVQAAFRDRIEFEPTRSLDNWVLVTGSRK